jgi:hypothetical protein
MESIYDLVSKPKKKTKADYESEIANLKRKIKALDVIVKLRDLEAILINVFDSS